MSPTAARRSATNTRTTRTKASAEETPAVEEVAAAPEEDKKESISQKRNRLRNEAERIIINKYRDEFNKVAENLFAENGLTFHRRLTDEEKAAKEIADRLNQFPELRNLFAQVGLAQAAASGAKVQEADVEGNPVGDPYDMVSGQPAATAYDVEPDWAEQQQVLRDVAAAEGVEFREGE